jgi:hypothetical protein
MSMGKKADLAINSNSTDLGEQKIPIGEKSRLRYLAWASVIPAAWLILKAARKSRKRHEREDESQT